MQIIESISKSLWSSSVLCLKLFLQSSIPTPLSPLYISIITKQLQEMSEHPFEGHKHGAPSTRTISASRTGHLTYTRLPHHPTLLAAYPWYFSPRPPLPPDTTANLRTRNGRRGIAPPRPFGGTWICSPPCTAPRRCVGGSWVCSGRCQSALHWLSRDRSRKCGLEENIRVCAVKKQNGIFSFLANGGRSDLYT